MLSKYLQTSIFLAATIATAANAAPKSNWAQLKYERLSTPEMRVIQTENGGPVVGSRTEQKSDPDGGFCRAVTAVAPGAQPSYACYTLLANDADAVELYESSESAERQVSFYIGESPMVGRRWNEKVVTGSRFGIDLLCVKTNVVVPGATSDYNCYGNVPPVGGGISVGN